ncbi:MAG: beta-ketoacyl synthase chain length factor [Gammaproteobacteria bacterium]|nr:beta-ketoacyl synthase chain length factor [Gammaproteobacteria bacterium]
MLRIYLKSIGIIAPGVAGWNDFCNIAKGVQPLVYEPVAKKIETVLPANERRRATRVTQLALYTAQQACDNVVAEGFSAGECLQIFNSSNGDVNTFHKISMALVMPGRPVSPTLFHNSVHNAPAGYWSIAAKAQTASTSITAHEYSFAAGLLEAAVQLISQENNYEQSNELNKRDCLLVCCDDKPPEPFHAQGLVSEEFACAFVLSNNIEQALFQLDIQLSEQIHEDSICKNPEFINLQNSNPQAKALPIIESVALNESRQVVIPYFEQGLNILLTPLN